MAKKPAKSIPGPRASQLGRSETPSTPKQPAAGEAEAISRAPAPAEPSELDELEAELSVSAASLDDLENRLSARLGVGDLNLEPAGADVAATDPTHDLAVAPPEPKRRDREAAAPVAAADEEQVPARRRSGPPPTSADDDTAASAQNDTESEEAKAGAPSGPRSTSSRKFGTAEWAALGGFAVLALLGAVLFFKFLYAHPAPTQGKGLPSTFTLPLAGPAVRLSQAEAGWRERVDGDKARAEEVVLPVITLTLDPAQPSTGYVRVEFVDPDDKIRGDILTVAIEGGRFKDGGRGEIIEDGGLKVRLTSTYGFRSHALFMSYMAGQEPRWSVRVKEGPDSSNGPWTELGASLIPNTKQ